MPDLLGRGPLGLKVGNPKRGTAEGRRHMAKVAAMPCVICGHPPPSQCHHCISGRYGQRKASDFETIPLCWLHHQGPEGIHANKRAWEDLHGPDTGFLPIVAAMIEKAPSR